MSRRTAQTLRRLVVAQDTGGAIRGPVRGDLFWGFGPAAEARAGRMRAEGAYYMLLPRNVAPARTDACGGASEVGQFLLTGPGVTRRSTAAIWGRGRCSRRIGGMRQGTREIVRMRSLVTAVALVAMLGACTPTGDTAPGQFGVNNTTGGTLLGAGLGGLLGNQFGHGAGKGVMTAAA